MPPLLVARDLRVAYADLVVLDGVSLTLDDGTLTVVTAADSAGTSTLLRVLAGAQAPDAGTVEGGPTAFLSQPPGDDWGDHDRVSDHAPSGRELLGVDHLGERELWMLSAGERQRVRLAAALQRPEPVLLLDEPLGGLDRVSRRRVLELVRTRPGAVLAVVRDDDGWLEAADAVLVLEDGRLRAG